MVNRNYRKGTSFEARFIANLIKDGAAVKAGRFYGSKGICDVWWVDKNGVHHEAQLKFSSKKKPYIPPAELLILKEFAKKMDGYMKVWLVKKQSRRTMEIEALN